MKPVTVVHFFALSGCNYMYVFSLLNQQFLKAQKKLGLRQPNCVFGMKTGRAVGRLLRNIIRRKGLQVEGQPPLSGLMGLGGERGGGNLRLGRKTVLSYLPILQAFVKQLLLPFAIQMSLPGSVVVEQIFLEKNGSVGSGAGLGYLTGFLGFHECVQKLVSLERNFFVLMKGSF